MKKIFIILLLFNSICLAVDPKWDDNTWNVFLDSIQKCESNGSKNNGIGLIGDNGKAIGPFQIWKSYYDDAIEYDPSLKNKNYKNCLTDTEYSKKVVKAYVCRYLPKNGTIEMAARIHNGGPKGYTKKSTIKYLEKFKMFIRILKNHEK